MSNLKELIRVIGSTCVIYAAGRIVVSELPLLFLYASRYGDITCILIFAAPVIIVCPAAVVKGFAELLGKKLEEVSFLEVVLMSVFAAMSAMLGYVHFRFGEIISVLYAGSMAYSIIIVINFLKIRKKMKEKKQTDSQNKQYPKIDEKFDLWDD